MQLLKSNYKYIYQCLQVKRKRYENAYYTVLSNPTEAIIHFIKKCIVVRDLVFWSILGQHQFKKLWKNMLADLCHGTLTINI